MVTSGAVARQRRDDRVQRHVRRAEQRGAGLEVQRAVARQVERRRDERARRGDDDLA